MIPHPIHVNNWECTVLSVFVFGDDDVVAVVAIVIAVVSLAFSFHVYSVICLLDTCSERV